MLGSLAMIFMTSNDIELKINLKSEFENLKHLIIITVITFTIILTFLFYYNIPLIASLILIYYLVFNLFPVLILHNNYEKHNRNKSLIFSENYLLFGNKQVIYEDILCINIYGTYQSINKNSAGILPYQSEYFYIEILNNKNEKLFLTSLYSTELENIFNKKLSPKNINRIIVSFPKIKNYR